MKELFKHDQINYIVRTYLPHWRNEERVEEIIHFCRQTGAEHVMLFTDPQELTWNQLTLEDARIEAASIQKAGQRLAQEGIRFGINSTYNMPCSKQDHRGHNDYDHWATLRDGSCSYQTPCLLDSKLDIYLRKFYTILAQTGPDYIYLDDDHRYVWMGVNNTLGCFCALHLREFGKLTGQKWTRESLHTTLMADKTVRAMWIDFLGKRLVEIGSLARQTIHAVNPNIRVGMMVPCVHCLPAMGHTIINILDAISGNDRPLVRPCMGPYQDWDRRQIMPGLFYMEYLGFLLGGDIDYTGEAEVSPYTRFSKSATMVRFDILQFILNGVNNHAFTPAGYSGDSPFLEPAYAPMLAENKPFFEGLRKITPSRTHRRGIQFIWHCDAPKLTEGTINSVTELYWPSFVAHDVLTNLGFPVTYQESPIRFLAGESVRALSAERIKEILGQGIVLEAKAARALSQMGYDSLIGCSVTEEPVLCGGGEACISEEFFGPYVNTYIPLNRIGPRVVTLSVNPNAQQISSVTDNSRKPIAPGVILYENSLGGKIAVLPFVMEPTDEYMAHFMCYHRLFMFKRVFDWMNAGAIPLIVEDPSIFAVQVWDDGRRLTACLTNMSYDIAESITVRFGGQKIVASTAMYLDDSGNLVPLEIRQGSKEKNYWEIHRTIQTFRPLILAVEYEN